MRQRMVYAEVSRSAEGAAVALGASRPCRVTLLSPRHLACSRAHLLTRLIAGACAALALLALCSASASAKLVRPLVTSFGSFNDVQGVAVNQSIGDVYVYDSAAEAIYKFDESGDPVDFSATGTNEITGVPSAGAGEGEIAIDDSTGPAKGDIYLSHGGDAGILVFDSAGDQIGSLTQEAGVPWGETCGVAVGQSGAVYVGIYAGDVNKYVPKANPVTNADYSSSIGGVTSPCNVAVDGAGNVFAAKWNSGPITRYEPNQFGSSSATGSQVDGVGSTLAVDPANNEVYVDEGSQVSQFGAEGEPFESPVLSFGLGSTGSYGVAVNEKSHDVYVSSGNGKVSLYGSPTLVPTAVTGPASNVAATTATVTGEVNPEGLPVEECYFEYGETSAYGMLVQCVEEPSQIGEGTKGVVVHAELSGLDAGVTYHYRLVAANKNGAEDGGDSSFAYLIQKVEGEYAVAVSASGATLGASIDPEGRPTEYHFEYGTTKSYGTSTATGEVRGEGFQAVRSHISELQPETTYHYRLVTNSLAGPVAGTDQTFTTEGPGGPLTLLDGRQWELVSPPVKYGAGILVEKKGGGSIVEASTSGDAVTYIASNPIESEPEGNSAPEASQIISRRGAGGVWQTRTLDLPNEEVHQLPIGHGLAFKMFTPDLSVAALEDFATTPLAPDATEERAPYLWDEAACNEGASSCFTPTLTRENTMPGAKWDSEPGGLLLETRFVDATEDLEDFVISSEAQLTEGAAESVGAFGSSGLYEWSGGRLQFVSINEAGEAVHGALGGYGESDVRGAISNDGSRLFWCETACAYYGGPLFMRDMTTKETLRIDEEGDVERNFQIATEDGGRVFYTQDFPGAFAQELWECTIIEVSGKAACEQAEVAPQIEGLVLGINASGTLVYFVSEEVLAEGAEANGNNLYVSRLEEGKWEARLIAALSPKHGAYEGDTRDWGAPNSRVNDVTARVSPNGRYLAFMSERSLTGYDNHDAVSGEPDQEVYLYDNQAGKLVCVSCSTTDARPDGLEFGTGEHSPLIDSHGALGGIGGKWVAADIPTWEASDLENALYQPRYLSNEGRLFFNSVTPLVPQDSNGLADVYEYEPSGAGSCTQATSCVQLISSGTSGQESAFLEASENGNDAFFVTTAHLSAEDTDTEYDVYDAHVCTSAAPCEQTPVSPPPCSNGESCKPGQAPQPAIFGAPASATFSGAGNLTPAVPATRKAKTKAGAKKAGAKKRAAKRKLKKRLRACRRAHRGKAQARLRCERRARRRAHRGGAHGAAAKRAGTAARHRGAGHASTRSDRKRDEGGR